MSSRVERRLCRLERRLLSMTHMVRALAVARHLDFGPEHVAEAERQLNATAALLAEALTRHVETPPPKRRPHARPNARKPRKPLG
jgi:hypothetical protein